MFIFIRILLKKSRSLITFRHNYITNVGKLKYLLIKIQINFKIILRQHHI